MTVACPVCHAKVDARPIEVIARGQRQRLRRQVGRRLDRVEVVEHDGCHGAGLVVAAQETAP